MNATQPVPPGQGPVHGRYTTYVNWNCRCAPCTEAWAAYIDKRKHERVLAAGAPQHGTENGYGNYRCRCRDCTSAWSTANYARKLRRAARLRADI